MVFLKLTGKAERPDPRLLWAAIVESSDDAIISKTLDGTITSWNQGATRIFGYEADDMIGRHVLTLIPAGRENEEPAIIARLRKGERIDHSETVRRHKDGHFIDVSLTISPIHDAQGTVIGASKIARDITERKAARAAMEEAAVLRGAVAEAESFSYMVTHDLRTPLRAIEGFSRRLQRTAPTLDAEAKQSLDFIVGAVDKMSATIDGLLELTRVSRAPLKRQPIDVSAAARAILAEQLAGLDRPVDVVIPAGIRAEADAQLVHVILSNLLGNALKFTRRLAIPRIEVGVAASQGQPVTYFVRDNGIGFAPEEAAELFTAFNRLNPESEFEGSGIGLATVRRAVERHGGRAWAEGVTGRGATVYFTWAPAAGVTSLL